MSKRVDWLERAICATMLGVSNCGVELGFHKGHLHYDHANKMELTELAGFIKHVMQRREVSGVSACKDIATEFFCQYWGGIIESDDMYKGFEAEIYSWISSLPKYEKEGRKPRDIWPDVYAAYDLAHERATQMMKVQQ